MIRVLVVDDHPMARAAMVDMVVSTTSLVLVGTATDGRAGVALAERIRPDVVLVDMSMSAMSCIEATQRLVGKHPTMRVIMFNGEGRPSVVEAAQEAGAAGFLRRGSSESEVIRVIRSVMAGLPMWPAESRPERAPAEGADGSGGCEFLVWTLRRALLAASAARLSSGLALPPRVR